MNTLLTDLTNERIRDLIEENRNRFCSVVFMKRDGTLRRMFIHQAQMQKHVLGTERGAKASATRAANNPDQIIAWDNGKKAFRSFHLGNVLSVRARGRTHRFRNLAGIPIEHDAVPLPARAS